MLSVRVCFAVSVAVSTFVEFVLITAVIESGLSCMPPHLCSLYRFRCILVLVYRNVRVVSWLSVHGIRSAYLRRFPSKCSGTPIPFKKDSSDDRRTISYMKK
jgi:hypothetical protein